MRLRASTLCVLVLAGCQCGRKKDTPSEPLVSWLVPADVQVALIVPRLALATARLGDLGQGVSRIPGGAAVGVAFTELAAQLKADLRTPEGLKALGLDPDGSAAVWLPQGSEVERFVVALPVGDAAVLDRQLAGLAKRGGAVGEAKALPGGAREHRAADGHLVLADRTQGGFVLVTVADARGLASPPVSLAGQEVLARLRARLGEVEAFAVYPGGKLLGFQAPAEVVLGLKLSGTAAHARLVTPMAGSLGTVVGGFGHQTWGATALPTSWLSLELGGTPEAWGTLMLARAPPELLASLTRAGIDPRQDVFGNLGPGVSFGLWLNPSPDFSHVLSFDPRRSNPFGYGVLRAVGTVRDPARAKTTLDKLAVLGKEWGVDYAWHSVQGKQVLTGRYAFGETVSLALIDHTLVLTGGSGEMERALREPLPAAPLAKHPLAALRIEPATLAAQIDAVPATAYGGLSGLTARSLFSRLVEPLRHLGTSSLVVDFDDDVLTADLDVPLQ